MLPRVISVSRLLLGTIIWILLSDRWWGECTTADVFPPLEAFKMDGTQRKSLLEEAVAMHRKGELHDAGTAYSRLLEVSYTIPGIPLTSNAFRLTLW